MPRWPDPQRIADVEAEARKFIATGDGHRAANYVIVWALQPAAQCRRRGHPADALLADAELAARLMVLASQWHEHEPPHPSGYVRKASPAHGLAVFDGVLQAARKAAAEEVTR